MRATTLMWYDHFSNLYDGLLEKLYAPYRSRAIEVLALPCGSRLLDLPCGTGQSFEGLSRYSGDGGHLIGIDLSKGMLRKAERRVHRLGLENIQLEQASIRDINGPWLEALTGEGTVDGVFCALGLSALPDWESSFDTLFSLLREGGRFVLMDVYSESRGWSRTSVEWIARADLGRKAWGPLAERCEDFSREVLSTDHSKFGGDLYVASGTKAPVG